MHIFPIRIEHGLFEFRISDAPAKLVRKHRALSSRIYNNVCIKLLAGAVLHLHLDADGAISFEEHLLDQHTLMHNSALFLSVIDQHVIEFGTRDLPRHRAFVMHTLEEVERARLLPRGVCKLHAVLAHERTLFEFLEQAQAAEGPIGVSHQRFADVVTRKYFLLKQDYLAAFARQDAGNRTPCGSTTHYYDVVFVRVHA